MTVAEGARRDAGSDTVGLNTVSLDTVGLNTVALVGVTAAGKSAAALEVARVAVASGAPPVELVSVDSMAVYRGMDIGTDKPGPAVRAEVPYHLIDIAEPDEDFSVRAFQDAAALSLAGIAARRHRALLVGGTGLYLRAVVDGLRFPGRFPHVSAGLMAELTAAGSPGSTERRRHVAELHTRLAELDPPAAARMEMANERRILRALEVTLGSGRPFSSFGPGLERYPDTPVTLIGIQPDLAGLDRRIHDRMTRQMEAGFLDEVARLDARPGGLSRTARQALGYRELRAHLHEGVPLTETLAAIEQRTRAFARRQWAWFRRDPRIEWVDSAEAATGRVVACLSAEPGGAVGDWPGR
jgi:tRNA dimethylallyltransferase